MKLKNELTGIAEGIAAKRLCKIYADLYNMVFSIKFDQKLCAIDYMILISIYQYKWYETVHPIISTVLSLDDCDNLLSWNQ